MAGLDEPNPGRAAGVCVPIEAAAGAAGFADGDIAAAGAWSPPPGPNGEGMLMTLSICASPTDSPESVPPGIRN